MTDTSAETRIKMAEAAATVGKMSITVWDIAPVYAPKDYTVHDNLAMKSFENGSVVVLSLLPF